MGRQAPPKLTHVLEEVRRLLDAGFYYETTHARMRMAQLRVREAEVRHVLKNGLRDPVRDEYDWDNETWKYVVQGTFPGRERPIRVAFALSSVSPLPNAHVIVITVILL